MRNVTVLMTLALCAAGSALAGDPSPLRFAFGSAPPPDGYTSVALEAVFSREAGFGFEPGAAMRALDRAVTSEQPFLFSVVVPEGNHRIALTLEGAGEGGSVVTVRAEARRLMLERVPVAAGEIVIRTIVVNVRTPALPPPERNAPGGGAVILGERETGTPNWDDRLTLEFNGTRPTLRSIVIEPADDLPTVYLAGDSTVTDQPGGDYASWGQMLPRFLQPGVAVANHAQSGETMKSFISGLRLAKVLERMKPGDTLLIQFGHNDSKRQWPQTWAAAGSTYNAYLKAFIAEARLRGATPVLVTSMQRRQFDEHGRVRNSHGDYPDAVRQVAREESVALIDLDLMSRALYEALGPEQSPRAFANGGRDATHHNAYGAYQLAQCIVQGLRDSGTPLAASIVDEFSGYDPARPDDPAMFNLPASPGPERTERPRGN